MKLSNSHLLSEKHSNFLGWGKSKPTVTDIANVQLAQQGASSTNANNTGSNSTSVNQGRAKNDGSGYWQDILLAGANVLNQFGNQNQVDDFSVGQYDIDDTPKKETKILGMHPLTFGVVSLITLTIGGIVIYKVTKK